MASIALFHSVPGVRQGVLAATETFEGAGHDVRIIGQYGDRVFDDYDEASEFAESRNQEHIDGVLARAGEAGADIEMLDYPGRGHLFTDASLPEEFDEDATELHWQRVLAVVAHLG